jgi:Glycosyl transferases group 1
MPDRRIFYYCPRSSAPSGGVLTIYHHVETLARNGIDAWVLHRRRGAAMSWFDSAAPVATLDSGVAPRGPDVLVIPEGDWRLMAETVDSGLARVVFAQGASYIYGGHEPLPEGCDWRTWQVRDVMAVSRWVQRFVRHAMGLPSALVPPGVDLATFRPAPHKRLQVACMPRKNADDLQQIQGLLRSRFPRFRQVPFVPIDGVPHPRVAQILAQSAVFLATGYPEGFGLPALEALASGCLVVGFAGRGARDFLRLGGNCLLAADGDVMAAADRLGQALDLLHQPGGDAALIAAGLATAGRFSRAASERRILRTWRRYLRRGDATAHPGGEDGSRLRRWRGLSRRVAVLSVHYRYPELLADQMARLERCVAPTREALGLRLEYFPILHHRSQPAVRDAARAACANSGFATCVDVREQVAAVGSNGGRVHGASLTATFEHLRSRVHLDPDDLVVLLDHDTHPLDRRLFARLGEALRQRPDAAGVGIPQWHRGHCYLHPSLLAVRAATVFEMGPRQAFEVRLPPNDTSDDWHDTGEGFTVWCEHAARPLLPLRVNGTVFPWESWDSDMVPSGGARFTGEHGEPVQVGNLMHYGLDAATSLASHVWAGPLGPYRWLGFCQHDHDAVFAAYLAEPLAG